MAGEYKSSFPKKNRTRERSAFFNFYADTTGDIDVIGDGPENGNDTPNAEIHVFGGGDLEVERGDGEVVIITDIPAGYVLPISVKRILDANSTATAILVLY